MGEAEKRQIIEEWNATERAWEKTRLAHELITEQAARNSEAIAVVAGEEQVSYRELNERANRLARYLRRLGVGPEVLVGICLERSVEMVTAVLGVLKAGGAYVPLNPSYPEERLTFMLEETQAPVLLTRRPGEKWASISRVVCLDSDWEIIAQEDVEEPGCAATAVNSAYLIYTSGSTGQPKGVVVRHGSLINAYWAWHEVYQLGSRATCHLQMASFSFDVCTGDLVRSL
jgi:non-ribosomal peptide synthetase component F